jgi:hypothetical protein
MVHLFSDTIQARTFPPLQMYRSRVYPQPQLIGPLTPEELTLARQPKPPSWLDACCGPRKYAEFYQKNEGALTSEEVVEILKLNQSGVIWVVSFQVVLLALWLLATIVPGFALYDGTSTFAYSHAAWWILVEVIVILTGAVATYFGMRHHSTKKVLERGVFNSISWINTYIAILALGAVAHLVHIISCWMEFSSGTSTLYTKFSWCFWIFLAGLHVELVLCLWGITRAKLFQTTLKFALGENLLNLSIILFESPKEEGGGGGGGGGALAGLPSEVEERAPLVNVTTPTKAQLMTPLLAQALRGNAHGYKK